MTRFLLSLLLMFLLAGVPTSAQPHDEPTNIPPAGWPTEAAQVPGSPLQFENLTVNDGLSEGSVQAIVQDYLGYMWFGTSGGLDRYDGYAFENYTPVPFDSTSLSDGHINGLYEDEEGTLWITTQRGGLNLLDARREGFTHYMHDENDPSSLGHEVLCKVHPSRSQAMWLCTLGGGLDRFDPETETFEHYRHVPGDSTSLSNNYVYDAYEDPSGYTWVATGNGLNRLNPEQDAFTRFLYNPGYPQSTSPVPGHIFRFVHPDPADAHLLWLGSGEGLVRFDARTGNYQRYLSAFVYSIEDDPNVSGVLWLAARGAHGGLYRFDTRTGQYSHYRHDPRDPESLFSNSLFSIAADRSGMIWTGSANGRGVSRFDPKGATFRHYRAGTGGPGSQSSVRSIQEDGQGRFWVAVRHADGRGELIRIDRASGDEERRDYGAENQNSYDGARQVALHVDHAGVLPLHTDDAGWIWVGTDQGLVRLDPETDRITRYEHDPQDPRSISWNSVRTLFEDRTGTLWVGTTRGLNRFDRSSGTFTRLIEEKRSPPYVPTHDITALHEDHRGILWIGTLAGLYTLDPVTGRTRHFAHEPRNPSSLSEDFVLTVHERAREPGIIWVGTRSGGLNRLDAEAGTFTHYTTKEGLSDNKIYAILEDEQGRLWMSTNRGLSCFDPGAGTFNNFTVRHGLQSMEFNHGAAYRSPTGEMFFGGPNGLNAFFPDRLSPNRTPPTVVIDELRLFNEPVLHGPDELLEDPIWQTNEVRLAHHQNTVSLGFTALHYQNPEANTYTYRLDPVEEGWVAAGKQRSVTYSNLSPGRYTFRVRAANSDGVWNEEGASVRLAIAPPWWRTSWAYVGYALLLIGAIAAVDRFQRRRLVQRERERARVREAQLRAEAAQEQAATLEQLDTLKSRFFANLSHEFRTPLTLILDPLEQMIEHADHEPHLQRLRMMRHQAYRLLHLIGQLLDLSKLDAGGMTLRARPIDLTAFLRNLVFAFSSRAEREDIALQFASEEKDLLLYAEPDKLEKVFTNLLSNAFKFTPSHGKVRVSLTSGVDDDGAYAEITIKDTGQGISEDELPIVFDRFYQVDASLVRRYEGSGIGLALTKELVELHGGTICVESEPGFGTAFTVRLRCGTSHLRPEDLVEEADSPPLTPRDRIYAGDETQCSQQATATSSPEGAPTVLLVEDNDDVRTYVRQHLAAHYHVEEATDGVEGLDKAQSLMPTLVIADVMMPRMDGYALCKALKDDATLAHVPVILLTAKASEESKVEGLETGADDYIYKPFSMQELLVRVENLIEVRRALRERFSDEMVIRPSEVSVSSEEAAFLEQVREAVEAELGNTHFTVEMLADRVGVSTRQLYRKLKEVAELSPGGLIRTMRLQRAAQLLEQDAGTIAEIAYAVGFSDPDYFSRLFRKTYGMPPSAYVASLP